MATPQSTRTPSLRHHRGSNRGYVVLNGKYLYLGRWGEESTREAYRRTLAQWLASGRQLPSDNEGFTISALCERFMQHAATYYQRADGTPSQTIERIGFALRPLCKLYGSARAKDFGPNDLRVVRSVWIEHGRARSTINGYIRLIKSVFKWATSFELIPPERYMALQAVEGLRKGRTAAKEPEKKRPVAVADIEAIRTYVTRQVSALIDLQLSTAARSSELLTLRPVDIDTSEKVWKTRPDQHKTAHHDKGRVIYFGPKAQAILREFMRDRSLSDYLFSPREGYAELRGRSAHCHRRAGQPENERQTARRMDDCYSVPSYRRAIARACKSAKVPVWSPHRLRHTAATLVRKVCGLEAAQVYLGHSQADVTQIYAERDEALAEKVAARMG